MQSAKANVLIVDDRPEKLLALEAVLEDLGETIVRAYSGREALRHVLAQEFAVILLDVNMPGMDGFETASLIRQRPSSARTPIIFITAFGDELHAHRGYSLGAVDYIQAPVVPEVLRTKVSVFVDLFKKTEQVRRQADSLRQRATQLQKLAAASVAINSAPSVERTLQTLADTARDVIGAHQAIALFISGELTGQQKQRTLTVCSFSDRYADWRKCDLELEELTRMVVARSRSATRLTEAELLDHPDWEILSRAQLPPIHGGILVAPFIGRSGTNLGLIYLTDQEAGRFSPDDESILQQLAQMGTTAVENAIYADEREANRLKDEFLTTLSHELRTPLNAILGWSQILASEQLSEEVAHGLEVINRNARAQAKLIEDLLDISRVTAGRLRLNVRPLALSEVVALVVDSVRPAAEAKGITIEVRLAEGGDQIAADPDRLPQVIWNLLSNALKFTPASGTIRAEVVPDELARQVQVRVSDTGQGIDPSFLPFVFDRFRQADSSSSRAHGGLGIGLTIVRHIVELHGGTVRAHSDGPGRGSVFVVELPLLPPQRPGTEQEAAPPEAAAESQPLGLPTLPAMRVMLVDDESDSRELAATLLRRCGAQVMTAGSCAEALQAIEALTPDVLISDLAMPREDGFDLIRAVRKRPPERGRDLPAIAVSSYVGDETHKRALAEGYQLHLPKPIDPAALIAALQHLTRKSPTEEAAPAV